MQDTIQLLSAIQNEFKLQPKDINTYSPLTLAYLGDAVYEIIIRTHIVEGTDGVVNTLHRRSSKLVNAGAQATLFSSIENSLTEEEITIYRRGRNAKSHSVAKNASIHDYRMATGFEALMGYLYLTNNLNRAIQLVNQGLRDSELLV